MSWQPNLFGANTKKKELFMTKSKTTANLFKKSKCHNLPGVFGIPEKRRTSKVQI